MMLDLPKVYDPKNVEEKWYKIWEENGYFAPENNSQERGLKTFTIVIPPPNVTGSLHMGHALDNTLQDILIRFKRMCGFKTLWVPGVDHAGIATQNVVEKELAKEKLKKEDLGREKFLERVWQWKNIYGGTITKQLRRLGASLDWSRERFTMDEGLSRAVKKAFVSLYNEGLIYKGKRMVNWCPRCKTAISDIEVEHENKKGKLWYIKYPLDKSSKDTKYIVVATTRPETMLGDTAVAVNPEDDRFKHLIGQNLILPLVKRKIPIIKDEFVDAQFGSGAVKVTPSHDPNDFEISQRHNLSKINILSENGKIDLSALDIDEKNRVIGLEGLDRFKAREEIVKILDEKGLIEKIEDYDNASAICYRCKTIIEPYLSDQWFVKVAPLAKEAIKAVKDGHIVFVPDRWTKVYLEWMVNLKDWCISRQIWWGHRIPVWYCECGQMIVSEDEPKECLSCKNSKLTQDSDVLDTWFSSSLWPFSTLGWPENTADLKAYYPTSVLITGYDIITFWVSKMIMMGLKFMKKEPFQTIYIHGLIRDISGKKMSKSLGNVIDPLNIIENAGADALRFALTSLSTSGGQDLKLSEEKITEGRNFANKIWNVSRFVLMQEHSQNTEVNFDNLEFSQKWILSRFNKTIKKTTELLDNYEFGEAARQMYEFVWAEFCDWYIEMEKVNNQKFQLEASPLTPLLKERGIQDKKNHPLPVGEGEGEWLNAPSILMHVLKGTIKLLHPFMPFETEEIYQNLKKPGDQPSIMLSKWPVVCESLINENIENEMALIMSIIKSIRNIRAEMNIPYSKEIKVFISAHSYNKLIMKEVSYIKHLCKANEIIIEEEINERPKQCASASLASIEIYIPLEGLIDFSKELERLNKALNEMESMVKKTEDKLSNVNFLNNAKKELVEMEKNKLQEYMIRRNAIADQIKVLNFN